MELHPAGLAERREDIEPNLDLELDRFAEREGTRVMFNDADRLRKYLAKFASDCARVSENRSMPRR